jgi:hypothetical protein
MTYRKLIEHLQEKYAEHLDDPVKLEAMHDNAIYHVFSARTAHKDAPYDDIKEDDLILLIEQPH